MFIITTGLVQTCQHCFQDPKKQNCMSFQDQNNAFSNKKATFRVGFSSPKFIDKMS